MPNIHKRTTDRGLVTSEIMDLAAEEVLLRKVPFRDAAKSYQLCHVTLYRYVQKKKKMLEEGSTSLPKVGYVSKKRVFNDEEEKILAEYLLHCSQINYGLSTKEVRTLAFQSNPKAGPRKNNGKGRKGRKTAIMTDTPNKLEIQDQEEKRTRSKVVKKPILQIDKETRKGKPSAVKKTIKKKAQKKKDRATIATNSGGSEDEDCFCLVCVESFSNSRPNEKWVQCLECKRWAHVDCTKNELSYVCHNCLSD